MSDEEGHMDVDEVGLSMWSNDEPFDDEMVAICTEEYNELRQKEGIWSEGNEQGQILRIEPQPNHDLSLVKIGSSLPLQEGAQLSQCVEISASTWTSFKAAGDSISSALGSTTWTNDDLDQETAASLFDRPLIVIRDINEKNYLAVEPFIHLFWTSKLLQQQQMEDRIAEFVGKTPGFTGELDITPFQVLFSFKDLFNFDGSEILFSPPHLFLFWLVLPGIPFLQM